MNNKLTVIQNFIVTKDSRMAVLKEQFNNLGDVLGDFKFLVNYDTDINLKEVKSLYKKNIPYLSFTNTMKKNWSEVTKSLIEKCNSKYIFYMMEDTVFGPEVTSKDFNKLLDEFINNKCEHINMGKVEKYIKHPWPKGNNKLHKYIRTFKSNHSPIHCMSIVGIWDKELFLSILDKIKPEKNAYSQLLQFERISKKFNNPNRIAATPIVKICNHKEDASGIPTKEWK